MNITKDIINDLLPLYVANECSADSRALVGDYLRQHPQEAAELHRIMSTTVLGTAPLAARLDEMESLRRARRLVRRRSWLMALAIFFSIAPFSFAYTGGHTHWFLLEAPKAALIYGALGVVFWIAFFVVRHRSRTL
jgi:hypothetical protein